MPDAKPRAPEHIRSLYLRQVLAYLDGEYTAREIEVYGHGLSYGKGDSK